jgi:hypothetical protein
LTVLGPVILDRLEDVVYEVLVGPESVEDDESVIDTGVDFGDDWSSNRRANAHDEAAAIDWSAMLNAERGQSL